MNSLTTNHQSLVARRGFTLLEVLLVLAISGILIGTGGAYLGGVTTDTTLEYAATAVIFDIKNVQVKSMNGIDGKRWGACFRNPATGDHFYELVSLSSGGEDACNAGVAAVESTFFLQEGVTYSDPAGGSTESLIFNKITGEADSLLNTVIILNLKGQERSVTITPAGRIY